MASWQIIRKLGEGGMGEVYLARRPEGDEVAVKVLAATQKDQLPLFEQEAKLLIKIRHPAIAAILGYLVNSEEIFGENRGPCFWMEYVEGEDLIAAASKKIRPFDPSPLAGEGGRPATINNHKDAGRTGEGEVFDWLKQSLDALQYLHGQSILHGDLSPRNVLIDKSGKVKLLDFGLASSFLGTAKFNAGTLPYLAPERVYGKNLPASDLFSIGTLFYEAISGTHPRASSRSLQEMIRTEAKPLAEAAPILAKDFGLPTRVIDRMIRVRLEDRFAEAGDVLQALSGGDLTKAAPQVAEYSSVRMYGAQEAFQKTEDSLKNIADRSQILLLHGITGTGKKRFLKELEFLCARMGIPVSEIAPPQLKEGLSQIHREEPQNPRAFFLRSLETLPMNDLALLMSFLRKGTPQKNFLFVFEWTDDALSEESLRFFNAFVQTPTLQEIFLQNLNLHDTQLFLEGALGKETAEEIAEVLHRQTGGNPKMLSELVHMIREMRLSTKKHFSKDWMERVASLHSFEDIILKKLETLNDEEKELLLALASAHFPVSGELLEKIAVLEAASLQGSWKQKLDSLIARNLAAFDPPTGLYRIALPSLEAALLQSIPLEKTEGFHRRWFQILSEQPGREEEKLHHALALRNSDYVTQHGRAEAESFQKKGERLKALKLVNQSLELVFEPAEASRLLRLKANLLNELGRYEEGLAVTDEIFALGADDEPRFLKTVKYWLISGILHQNIGRHEEAFRRFERCLQEAEGLGDPSLSEYVIRCRTVLGLHEMKQGNIDRAEEHFLEGLKKAESQGRIRAEILRNLAVVYSLKQNWKKSLELLEEAEKLYQNDHYETGVYATLLQKGNLALHHDDPLTAESSYRAAGKIAEAQEDELRQAAVWNNLGLLERKKGNLAPALELFTRALEIFRPLGNLNDLVENLTQHALAEISVGHFEKAGEEIALLRASAEKIPKAASLADYAEAFLSEIRDAATPPLEENTVAPDQLSSYWNRELVLRQLKRGKSNDPKIEEILTGLYEKLPVALKVSFAERADYKKWVCRLPSPSPMEGEGRGEGERKKT